MEPAFSRTASVIKVLLYASLCIGLSIITPATVGVADAALFY